MLAGLKVLSLACKRVFHGARHNANGGPYEIEFQKLSNGKIIHNNG